MNDENEIDLTPTQPAQDTADATIQETENVDQGISDISEEEILGDDPDFSAQPDTLPPVKPVVEMKRSPISPEPEKKEKNTLVIVIPPMDNKSVLRVAENLLNEELSGENQSEWLAKLKYSLDMLPENDLFYDELNKVENQPTNTLEYNGKVLALRLLNTSKNSGREAYEGERAMLQVIAHRGRGGVSHTPLWNSGFYVVFKPAISSEFVDLLATLNTDTLQAGRSSFGLALSSDTVILLNRVMDFVLSHVYTTSLDAKHYNTLSDLKKYIKPQDIWSFLWGFLCATFKTGIVFEQPCVSDPSHCNRIDRGRLDLSLLQIPFKSKLPEWHLAHMSKTTRNSMSLDSVLRYQSELPCQADYRFIIDPGQPGQIAITLSTPTTDDYINQSVNYINSMVAAITKSVGEKIPANVRNKHIEEKTRATSLCKYSHFVSKIEIGNVDEASNSGINDFVGVITEREGIERSLGALSAEPDIRDRVITEISNYISRSSASAIGIPSYHCPSCHKPPKDSESVQDEHMKTVIPVDLLQLFFELVSQNVQKAVE